MSVNVAAAVSSVKLTKLKLRIVLLLNVESKSKGPLTGPFLFPSYADEIVSDHVPVFRYQTIAYRVNQSL
jgi:hypothetical protein